MRTGQSPLTQKVIGGIVGLVGITQPEKAHDKFFVMAPELSRYCVNSLQNTHGSDNNDTRTQHHDITAISIDDECSETDRCVP